MAKVLRKKTLTFAFNFTKFTEKDPCPSLFSIKLNVSSRNFDKKEAPAQLFSFKIFEILKNIYFVQHLRIAVSVYRMTFKQNQIFSPLHLYLQSSSRKRFCALHLTPFCLRNSVGWL